MTEWVKVSDRLPADRVLVALMDVNRYANNGALPVDNEHVCAVGYLNNDGLRGYWSIRGERGQVLEAFTHWAPLPVAEGLTE